MWRHLAGDAGPGRVPRRQEEALRQRAGAARRGTPAARAKAPRGRWGGGRRKGGSAGRHRERWQLGGRRWRGRARRALRGRAGRAGECGGGGASARAHANALAHTQGLVFAGSAEVGKLLYIHIQSPGDIGTRRSRLACSGRGCRTGCSAP